jgi:Zn-finger nucleic acid-binding protein
MNLHCPQCQSVLKPMRHGSIQFAGCPGCHGSFLTAAAILESDAHDFKGKKKAKLQFRKGREKKPALNCPECKTVMHKKFLPLRKKIILDRCPKCHAVWFDKDELDEFIATPEKYDEIKIKNRIATVVYIVGVALTTIIPGILVPIPMSFAAFGLLSLIFWAVIVRTCVYGKMMTQWGDVDV